MVVAAGYLYDLLRKVGLSRFGARTGEFLLVRPLKVLLVLVLARMVARVGVRWVRRSVRSLQLRTPLLASSDRAEQRAVTIAEALAGVLRILVWSVAILIVFDQLGINLAPLLAGAGIAGIAIGFGAQTLVRDFISGLFILVEDQYGVGDAIDLGGTVGVVENVNLRVTRMRSVDGKVWFVPNGEIRKVGNASLDWGRAVVDVVVPRDADVPAALAAAVEECAVFGRDEEWSSLVLGPPEVWGVESVTPEGVTIRAVVQTAPADQAAVGRALRGRLTNRLQRAGIGVRPATDVT